MVLVNIWVRKIYPLPEASDIVLATQAFITHNAHVTTAVETERFLDENQPYLDNIGDISDIIRTLKRISDIATLTSN